MLKKIGFLFFLIAPLFGLAKLKGKPLADSLISQLPKFSDDTNKVHLLSKIVDALPDSLVDVSMEYANQELTISEKIGWKKGKANALYDIGYKYLVKADYARSEASFRQGIALYHEINDWKNEADGYIEIASGDQKKSDTSKLVNNCRKALAVVEGNGSKTEIAEYQMDLGEAYIVVKDYDKARDLCNRALNAYNEAGNKRKMAKATSRLITIFSQTADYPDVLKYSFDELSIYEELKDTEKIAECNDNVGNIYFNEDNFSTALLYYLKGLNYFKMCKDTLGIAGTLVWIGNVNTYQQRYDSSIAYMLLAKSIYEQQHDKSGVAFTLLCLGDVYSKNGDIPRSLAYNFGAYRLAKELGSDGVETNSIGNIGGDYLAIAMDTTGNIHADSLISADRKENLRRAIKYITIGLDKSKMVNNFGLIISFTQSLSEAYELSGDFKKALELHKIYSDTRDSIFSNENNEKMTKMEIGRDKDIQNKQILLDQLAVAKKRNERVFYMAGIALLAIVAGVIFRSNRNQIKANKLLSIEKDQISRLKTEIEEKHAEIIDSVNYSKRIQTAILPTIQELRLALPQSFVLFMPRDIVSGDFYWFSQKQDKIILAAVDCTGHGVPGAFMSMIGNTLLNEIVNEKNIVDPAIILTTLDHAVNESLRQNKEGAGSKDGMDISICNFDLDTNLLQYAGANRPLWLIRNNELLVIKPDKYPIGGLQMAQDRHFTNHHVQLQAGDSIYIFTDGFADQFGGENGKKLMTAKFKELLLNIQPLTMHQQGEYLKEFFEQWKGRQEQVDDVLVIGVRV